MSKPTETETTKSSPQSSEAQDIHDESLPLFLSDEFRPVYLLLILTLALFGMLLATIGSYQLMRASLEDMRFGNYPGVIYIIAGVLLGMGAFALRQARLYFRRQQRAKLAAQKKADLISLKEDDFEKVDEILQIRDEKARADFERNASDAFLMKSLELKGVDFFDDCVWNFRPGVNVLLGRNGFGKSLLLRSLAALLQRNEEASKDLFTSASGGGQLQLTIERGAQPEVIRRQRLRFTDSPGKIPILAIPDSRFVNRADTLIESAAKRGTEADLDLRADGARHFLESRPYGEMITELFNELCFDYLQDQSFDQPIFHLLQDAIYDLTEDRFRFDSVEREGRTSFRLMVLTEGNDRPLPIQYASQGTLSVLGVMGIIRSYLQALFPNCNDEELLKKPAIVFIDELDAHLHPLWQQKLTNLLRRNFPNIQFILSAHSPLVVSGCWVGEVAVLRKGERGLYIEQLERDFLTASLEEIYQVIFGVEDYNDEYLQSASRAVSGFSHQGRISELEKKEEKNEMTELERRELPRLIREENMVIRAATAKVDRESEQDRILELEAKVMMLEDKLQKARSDSPEQSAAMPMP